MNKWTKSNVVGVIKEQLKHNTQMFERYCNEDSLTSNTMTDVYLHAIWEDIDILIMFGYFTYEEREHMTEALNEYRYNR